MRVMTWLMVSDAVGQVPIIRPSRMIETSSEIAMTSSSLCEM